MEISYNIHRSSFYQSIQEIVHQNTSTLARGYQIQITLSKGGGWKVGETELIIDLEDGKKFQIDREYSEEQHFSARLTALATVLRDEQLFGIYKVSHNDGLILVRKIMEQKICENCCHYAPVPISNKFLDDSISIEDFPYCEFYDDFPKVKPKDTCASWKSRIENLKKIVREYKEEIEIEKIEDKISNDEEYIE